MEMHLALRGSGSFCHMGKLAEFGPRTRFDLKIARKMALWVISKQMPETMKKAIKARRRLCLSERAIIIMSSTASTLAGQIWNNDNSSN